MTDICLGFRVRARDALDESDWTEAAESFGSCPFLFVWDGDMYAFESDIFPPGRLGTYFSGSFQLPFPRDFYPMQRNDYHATWNTRVAE